MHLFRPPYRWAAALGLIVGLCLFVLRPDQSLEKMHPASFRALPAEKHQAALPRLQHSGHTPSASAAAASGNLEPAKKPPQGASLSLFPVPSPAQAEMLRHAELLQESKPEILPDGSMRQRRLWQTSFKYPQIREEVITRDGSLVRHVFSVADHVMVRFPAGMDDRAASLWAQSQGFQLRQARKTTGLRLVSIDETSLQAQEKLLEALQRDFPTEGEPAAAVVAEPDWLLFSTETPDDPQYSQLWGLHNSGQTGGVADADIDAPEAWNRTTGSRSVVVGVIDSGVAYSHEDLAANMWKNPGEIANGKDDDGNGFVDDIYGYDFFQDDSDPYDGQSHGTHCAGTIGAVGDDGIGVTGVNWQVSIMALRFLGTTTGTTSDAIQCVEYATLMGATLTSNSWGGGGFSSLLQDAIENAGQANQLFVAAAGNNSRNADNLPHYPSSYTLANIVSVASSTDRDELSSFSNFGAVSVDLAAPGSSIYSTTPGGYGSKSGTSMATPHVAGALALAYSIRPGEEAAAMKEKLLETADAVPAFVGITSTGGRLNVQRFVEALEGPFPGTEVTGLTEGANSNNDGIINPGEEARLDVTVTNRGTTTALATHFSVLSAASDSSLTIVHSGFEVGNLLPGQTWTGSVAIRTAAELPTPHLEKLRLLTRYRAAADGEEQESERLHVFEVLTSSMVRGQVRTDTGAAIAGAQVRISGRNQAELVTNDDGRFEALLTDGPHDITVYAAGFLPNSPLVIQTPPGQEDLVIVLKNYPLVVRPGSITENVFRGDVTTRELILSNQGEVPLNWSLAIRSHNRPESFPSVSEGSGQPQLNDESVPLPSLQGVRIGQLQGAIQRDSQFLQELRDRGAVLVTISGDITDEVLADLDVLLVDDSFRQRRSGEIEALRYSMAQAGLGILCEADDELSVSFTQQLLSNTGIYPFWTGYQQRVLTDFPPHKITQGISALRAVSSGFLATLGNQAIPLAEAEPGKFFAAAARVGNGAVVFAGNELTDLTSVSQGDNRRFAYQAIEWLAAGPAWIAASSESGSITPGGTVAIKVHLDGKTEKGGLSEANLVFGTDIPGMPDLPVPVKMTVQESPQVGALPPEGLEFGEVPEGIAASRTFVIHNQGTSPLTLGAPEIITMGEDKAATFQAELTGQTSVPRGGVSTVSISLLQTALPGRHEAVVRLTTNDPRHPVIEVPVAATRTRGGRVVLSPASTQATLKQGQSLVKNLTLKNAGKGPLTASVALLLPEGPSWAALRASSTPLRLAPGKSVRLPLDLQPAALPAGSHKAIVRVNTDDATRPVIEHEITLSVTASAVAAFEPLDFGQTYLGQGGLRTLQIRNISSEPLTLKSARGSSGFKPQLAAPITLALGESAHILVDFMPVRAGVTHTALSVAANVPGGVLRVPVSGVGVRAPLLKISPASLKLTTLPGQPLTRTVKVTNMGGEPLSWGAYPTLHTGSNWLHVDVPPGANVLAPGKSALVQVRLETTQHASGQVAGAIVFGTTNRGHEHALDLPVSLNIKGGGIIAASPASLDLGKMEAGSSSLLEFSLVNVGNGPAQLRGMTPPSKDFEILSPPSDLRLLPGQSVRVNGVFKAGSRPRKVTSHLSFRISEGALTQAKVLVKATVAPPAKLLVKPAKVEATLSADAAQQIQLTLSNPGGMDWSDLTATVEPASAAQWLVPSLPPMPLKAGTSAPLILTLNPRLATAGTQEAVVKISSAADPTLDLAIPVRVSVPEIQELVAEPATVTFPTISPRSSARQTVTLRNTGNAPIKLLNLISDAPELISTLAEMPQTLQPGTSTTLNVVYSPAGKQGPLEARLQIMAEGGESSLLNLPVAGTTAPLPALKITPDFVHISTRPGLTGSQTITLENIGEKTLGIIDIVSSGYFSLSTDNAALRPGQKMDVIVRSTAIGSQNPGTYSGKLTVKSNDALQPQIEMAATLEFGSSAYLGLDKTAINYGTVQQQTRYSTGFRITNLGNKPALLSVKNRPQGITTDWDSQPRVLYANSSIYLWVHLLPQALGDINELLVLQTDSPYQPTLSCEIRAQVVTPSHPVINQENLDLALETGKSETYTVTLSNQGQMAMTWNGSIQGMAAGAWKCTPATGSLSGGKGVNLSLTVNTSGLTPGIYSSSLQLTTDARPPNTNLTLPITLQVLPKALTVSTTSLKTATLLGQPSDSRLLLTNNLPEPVVWQVSSNVAWAAPDVQGGTGSGIIVVQYDPSLPAGTHTGTLTFSSATSQIKVALEHRVVSPVYSVLVTDFYNQGLLGLVTETNTAATSILVFLNGQTQAVEEILNLPAGTVAMDVSTDGRTLYALAGKAPQIAEVNLVTREITRTNLLPSSQIIAAGSRIQSGKQGMVYYTTEAPQPRLHAYNFESKTPTRSISLPLGAVVSAMAGTPNGDSLFVQASYQNSAQEGGYLARILCLPPSLPEIISQTSSVLKYGSPATASPVLLGADLRSLLVQDHFFTTTDLQGGEQGPLGILQDEKVWNASAYLDVLVTDRRVLNMDSGQPVAALPAGTRISAFVPDQSRLVYQHPDRAELGVVETAFLPVPGVRPEIPNGGVVGKNLAALSWSCDPTVAAYDVYFGSDPVGVQQATVASLPYFKVSASEGSWNLPPGALVPGQTYAWRIDRRNLAGIVVKGPVWTFKVAGATFNTPKVDARAVPEGSTQQNLQILAEPTAVWSLASEAAWAVPSQTSGQGSADISLTLNATGLSSGVHETVLTLAQGEEVQHLPVTMVVREPWHIVKMLADPTEPVIYALHRDLLPPYASWLLRVNALTGQVLEESWAGDGAVDLAATSANHLLYVLSQHGRTLRPVNRGATTSGPVAAIQSISPPQSQLAMPSASQLVTVGRSNELYLRQAATGQQVGRTFALPMGHVSLAAANGYLYTGVVREGQAESTLRQYYAVPTGLSHSTSTTLPGSPAGPLVVTDTSTFHLFFGTHVWGAMLSGRRELTLESDILAVTPQGDRAITRSAIYDIQGSVAVSLASLPLETEQLAVSSTSSGGHRWLLLYNAEERRFVPVPIP